MPVGERDWTQLEGQGGLLQMPTKAKRSGSDDTALESAVEGDVEMSVPKL